MLIKIEHDFTGLGNNTRIPEHQIIRLHFSCRFPSRVRSASTRSGELSTGSLLTQSQQKILGVGAKYDASTDEDIVTQERTVHSPDGKQVTCKFCILIWFSNLFL